MKTLFISLSSRPVFRNLFFFNGSVFEQLWNILEKRKDLRLVILVQEKDYDKFRQFFASRLHHRCSLEKANVKNQTSLVQKVFYFFYSYLVYTGTTKTLATMGMRPDEPPAGGMFRRYLTPLKIFIARVLGRSRFIKLKVVPFLYYRVFLDRPFQALFDYYQPDCVFISHLFGRFDTALLAEAKHRGAKTIGMISNWDHFDKYYLPFHVDTLLAQSEQIKNFALKYQAYRSQQILVTGYPHLDFLFRKEYTFQRKDVLLKLEFPQHAKYILYISGSAYCPDEPDIIEQMLQWAEGGRFEDDVFFVIRPYLARRSADKDFDFKKYNKFEERSCVRFYREDFWGDTAESSFFMSVMRHADVVIAIYSTAMLEAAALDRPLVGIGFDGHSKRPFRRSVRRFMLREHFKDVLASGGVRMTKNFDELYIALFSYLKNPALDQEKRMTLRKEALSQERVDGLASLRIAQNILSLMNYKDTDNVSL